MRVARERSTDNLTEILRAYRFPTLIVSIGLIVALICFQMALRHNIQLSESTFSDSSEQLLRTLKSDVDRHEMQVTSVAKMIGQIVDLKKQEFVNISHAFSDTTEIVYMGMYKIDDKKGLIPVISVAKYDTESPEDIETAMGADRLENTVGKADIDKTIYFSEAFKLTINGKPDTVAMLAAPVPHKVKKNYYLVALIDLSGLFEKAFATTTNTYNVRIYDLSGPTRNLIYEQYEMEKAALLAKMDESSFETLHFNDQMKFLGHDWDIHVYSSIQGFMTYIGLLPWITFSAVLAVTALLGYIVFQMTIDNVRIKTIVDKQTRSLRQYTEKLETSNRDLDDFAYIASHDLKEPLRGIHNYAEFLLEDYTGKLDEEGQKKLETLKKLSRRMENLIDTLLEFSRISREDMAFKVVDMNAMVHDVLETLAIMIDTKKVTVNVADSLPEVACDEGRVAELYRNLITNALKYNNKTIKMVEIGCDQVNEAAPGQPVFFVRDNGIGIPAEHQGTIFKIFRRLHGRDEFGGGTGSGLTIVKKIIDRHGGKIWVQSQENEGTTFFFTLAAASNDSK